MKKVFIGCVLSLVAHSAVAYHPCEPGNVVTDAVEGAVVGGVVGAIAGDAKTGAMIGGAAGVIDGAYDDAECDALIGELSLKMRLLPTTKIAWLTTRLKKLFGRVHLLF